MVDDVPDTVFVGVPLTVPETVCVSVGEFDAVLDIVAVLETLGVLEPVAVPVVERDVVGEAVGVREGETDGDGVLEGDAPIDKVDVGVFDWV